MLFCRRRVVMLLMGAGMLAGAWAGCGEDSAGRQSAPSGHYFEEAGVTEKVGSLPIQIIASPDGRYAFTTDAGYRQALHAVRTSDGVSVSHVDFSNKRPRGGAGVGEATGQSADYAGRSNGLYYGLAATADGRLYAAQGGNDSVQVMEVGPDGTLRASEPIKARKGDFPAGLAVDGVGHLFVANQAADRKSGNPYTATGSVAIYDTRTREELGRVMFSDSYGGTSNFPLAIAALPDGSRAYVASERDNAVYVLDTTDVKSPRVMAKVTVGSHPQAARISRDWRQLYVANGDSDTLTVIDLATNGVTDTILLRPAAAKDLPGCTPTNLDFSPDGKWAYVTLADINAVAVVDLEDAKVEGYLPTGWYPTAVAVVGNGKRLLVTAAKGVKARVPNMKEGYGGRRGESPLNLLEGVVQMIEVPGKEGLAKMSKEVLASNHFDRLEVGANPLKGISREAGVITHVIYIVKENRTYDQVLGDMGQGNGDKSLCLFGREVTPNQHALAERFVLLDNLYACGEVSGDGWCWSTQSMANAYVARNVPYHYSQRGRKFDFEGQNNGYPTGGFPARDEEGNPTATAPAFRDGAKAIPDVAEAGGGHLWDLCSRHGVSFRNYGFFEYFADEEAGVPGGPENYPTATGLRPAGHNLEGLTDIDFRRFDMDYADSDAPAVLAERTGDARYLYAMRAYGKYGSRSRFAEWNREFQQMLTKDPSGGAVPNLMFLRIPKDHTVGGKSGAHSPTAYVADNDYGVGQVVEAVSKSAIWEHCAIFVIEDDAQSGADHVDCHRTTGFVISPYMRRGTVDHGFYNTNSFLRTMELLLNLPPLTQFDATATSIQGWSNAAENKEAYAAVMAGEKYFAQVNVRASEASVAGKKALAELAAKSDGMDFVHPDAAPAEELNAIVWKLVRGVDSTPPRARGAAGDDD